VSFQARITVYPDVEGGFTPAAFVDLLQHHIALPGLDPAWAHTLIDVQVAGDGGSAELTVHSQRPDAPSLDRSLRVLTGTPPARVRAITSDGEVLAESTYPAPLYQGQEVEIGGQHYLVESVDHPDRDPVSGCVVGGLDWQVAVVRLEARPAVVPGPDPERPAETAELPT
jgi:hypothetical protein